MLGHKTAAQLAPAVPALLGHADVALLDHSRGAMTGQVVLEDHASLASRFERETRSFYQNHFFISNYFSIFI